MSSNFAINNIRDFEFILQEWLPTEQVFNYPQFAEYYSRDDVKSVLDPILKMCKNVIEKSNEENETHPVTFADGKVTTPPSFGPLFHKLQEEGWGTSNIDDSPDAMVLPEMLYGAVWELITAANPTFMPYVLLTSGSAGLIQSFGDEKVKAMFLPKMMNGTWSGTMCLTEPSAGTDVGDITSKAYPTDDPRIFKIKGNKIFITGGNNDFTENIIHLYLARIEGAKPGTGGISLFVVPKYWVNEDGTLEDNDFLNTGVEHKMGQHGSVTAALSAGENDKCRGWLLGKDPRENDGKGEGMAQMFQMMNLARLETGHMALSCIANAFANARDNAKQRVQGRLLTNPRGNRVPIIEHEEIKRTLLMGKAHVEAMRAMLFRAYLAFDQRHRDPDPEVRQAASDLIEIITPLCKAYPSDEGWWLISDALQTYGGYGYCEDYPLSQIARDMKIYSIWEGTNYIQSMDLVGRKMSMKGGAPFRQWFQEIADFYEGNKDNGTFSKEFAILGKAIGAYQELLTALTRHSQENMSLVAVYAHRVLTATAQLYCGRLILDQAILADQKAKAVDNEHPDHLFYTGKMASARYYLRNVVPNVWAVAEMVVDGDTSALDIPSEAFEY